MLLDESLGLLQGSLPFRFVELFILGVDEPMLRIVLLEIEKLSFVFRDGILELLDRLRI